jgi:hypothetical protein
MKEYSTTKAKRQLNIVFDFDGVICKCIQPYDHFKYGEPNQEIIRMIKRLYYDGHTIKLSTARLCPVFKGKPDFDVTTGKVKRHLTKHLEELGILHCFAEITGYKPYGHVYIDDRGLYYDGNNHMEIIDIIRKIADDNRV